MELSKIMAISGKPGLFMLVAQSKNGAIVESLTDQKRFPVFAHEKMSTLEEISVYTNGEDVPLREVLKRIFEKEEGQTAIDPKSEGSALRQYFESVLPDFDQERVYTSDIRKIISWYNLLQEKDLLDFSEPPAESATEPEPEPETEPETEPDQAPINE